ncbi:MAG: CoA-binding protein, partial [Rhodospirillales bacterium]|nr:CoA-binding protein [Rhodospirillales bacterium]
MADLAAALLNPRRIALIGASSEASRLTARAQIYLRRHGYTGEVFAINPRAAALPGGTILGATAYASLDDVPGAIDFAYVLVGTGQVEAAIATCAARRV